jgi:hypothetical protein
MKTALYVFLAILAAYAVIYIFERIVAFVKRVNRNTPKFTPYNEYRPSYSNYSSDSFRLRQMHENTEVILDKLDDLLEKVDMIEDGIVNDPKND